MRLDEAIRAELGTLQEVSVLVLFGSRARGAERPGSDLDVAVLPARSVEGSRGRLRLQRRIAAGLMDLGGSRVDVVLLDEAPELLRQRVLEHGRIVICRDPAAWRDLRIATMRDHEDRSWARRLLRRGLKRRLTEGGTDGRPGRALESFERTRRLSA